MIKIAFASLFGQSDAEFYDLQPRYPSFQDREEGEEGEQLGTKSTLIMILKYTNGAII